MRQRGEGRLQTVRGGWSRTVTAVDTGVRERLVRETERLRETK